MAGIGFVLRRLTRRDDILGMVQGYTYSAIVSSGPWLFTVLALAGISLLAGFQVEGDAVDLFRLVVNYNFAFSLVLSGPILMVQTRYLADRIFLRNVEDAPSMYIATLALMFVLHAVVVVPFYGFYARLLPAERVAAIVNFYLIDGIWLAAVFLSALKDYRPIAMAFGGGMAVAFAGAILLAGRYGAAGMITGFSLGLAIILFVLTARIFAEYPYPPRRPWGFVAYFRSYWQLAVIGFVSNAAIWVDKWVMWFAPEADHTSHGLVNYPAYDGAMFLAYLSIVPVMAVFIVSVETEFFDHYKRYFTEIQAHAAYDRIRQNQRAIIQSLTQASRNLMVLQGTICAFTLLLSPQLVNLGVVTIQQAAIFRFGVLGATFQVLLTFVSIVLAYFDLRRDLLVVQLVFLATNTGFSIVSRDLGLPFYGYGYFLAALVSMLFAYGLCARRLAQLPYLTFVRQNASIN